MDLSAIVEKVRKLLALATGNPNPNEAANAAAKAQELINAYRLDMADLGRADGDACEEASDPLYRGKVKVTWIGNLAGVVARANGCHVFWGEGGEIKIVGKRTNVELCRYLHAFVRGEIDRYAVQAVKARASVPDRAWVTSFKLAAVQAVGDRLREVEKTPDGSQALVLVKRDSEEAEAFAKSSYKLAKGHAPSRRMDRDAQREGYAAGSRVNLQGSALTGGHGGKLLT